MNKNNKNIGIIIAVVVAVVVIAGGAFYMVKQNNQKQEAVKMAAEKAAMMQKDSSVNLGEDDEVGEQVAMKKIDTVMEKVDDKMKKSDGSSYLVYSKQALDEAASERRILFFYANWCPTCRPVDTALNNNADKIPYGVKIIRVNFNDPDTDQEEKDLAKKYGVTYQHTFVQIDENGKQVNKWSGGSLSEILANIKN